jgi:hypothetical protein
MTNAYLNSTADRQQAAVDRLPAPRGRRPADRAEADMIALAGQLARRAIVGPAALDASRCQR